MQLSDLFLLLGDAWLFSKNKKKIPFRIRDTQLESSAYISFSK